MRKIKAWQNNMVASAAISVAYRRLAQHPSARQKGGWPVAAWRIMGSGSNGENQAAHEMAKMIGGSLWPGERRNRLNRQQAHQPENSCGGGGNGALKVKAAMDGRRKAAAQWRYQRLGE